MTPEYDGMPSRRFGTSGRVAYENIITVQSGPPSPPQERTILTFRARLADLYALWYNSSASLHLLVNCRHSLPLTRQTLIVRPPHIRQEGVG
jgi:hypothetical protein